MWKFIKKWWLLENLRKEISRHTRHCSIEELSMGETVLLAQSFFIADKREDHLGLAYKSIRRFSWILWWRKKDNLEKLKRRIQEYNDIFQKCIEGGYIRMQQTEKGLMPITTSLADNISGPTALIQEIIKRYYYVWIIIIIQILFPLIKKLLF